MEENIATNITGFPELFWLDNNDCVCIYYTIYLFLKFKSSEWSHFVISNLLTSDLKSVKKLTFLYERCNWPREAPGKSLTRLLRGRPDRKGGEEDFIASIDNIWYFHFNRQYMMLSLIVSVAYYVCGIVSFLESESCLTLLSALYLPCRGLLPRWHYW